MVVDAVKDAKEDEKKSQKSKKANNKKGDNPCKEDNAKEKDKKLPNLGHTRWSRRQNNVTPADNSKRKENSIKKV